MPDPINPYPSTLEMMTMGATALAQMVHGSVQGHIPYATGNKRPEPPTEKEMRCFVCQYTYWVPIS